MASGRGKSRSADDGDIIIKQLLESSGSQVDLEVVGMAASAQRLDTQVVIAVVQGCLRPLNEHA